MRYSYGTSDTSDTQVIQLLQVMQVRRAHLWPDFRVFAMLTGYWQACHFVHNRPTCVQSLQAAKSYCCSVSNWASVFRAAPFNRDPIIVSISLDHNIILLQFESLAYKCTESDLSPGIDYPCLQKLSASCLAFQRDSHWAFPTLPTIKQGPIACIPNKSLSNWKYL